MQQACSAGRAARAEILTPQLLDQLLVAMHHAVTGLYPGSLLKAPPALTHRRES